MFLSRVIGVSVTGRLVPLHVFFSSYRSFGDGKVSAFAFFFLELYVIGVSVTGR